MTENKTVKIEKRVTNFAGCLRHNLSNGWPVFVIVFIILLMAGPVFSFFSCRSKYENYLDNKQDYTRAYQIAAEFRKNDLRPTEAVYYDRYESLYAYSDYYRVMEFLDSETSDELLKSELDILAESIADSIRRIFSESGSLTTGIILFIIIFFCTSYAFSFDKGRKNTDFFGALPVKRLEFYASAVLSAFAYTAIPFAVASVLTIPVLVGAGGLTFISGAELWGLWFRYFVSLILLLIDYLALAVVANVLGNTKTVAFFINGILNSYVLLFIASGVTVSELMSGTFSNYIGRMIGLEQLLIDISPFVRMIYYNIGSETEIALPSTIIYFIVSMAIIVGGYFIFRARKAENSIIPSAFYPLRYPLQYLLMYLGAIGISLLFISMTSQNALAFIVASVISSLLSFICFNAIFEGSLKLLFKRARHLFILMGVVLFFIVVIFGDIFNIFVVPEPTLDNLSSATVTFSDDVTFTKNNSNSIGASFTEVEYIEPTSFNVGAFDSRENKKYIFELFETAKSSRIYGDIAGEDEYFDIYAGTSFGVIPKGILNEGFYEEYIKEYGDDNNYAPYITVTVYYGWFMETRYLKVGREDVAAFVSEKLKPLYEAGKCVVSLENLADSAANLSFAAATLWEMPRISYGIYTNTGLEALKTLSGDEAKALKLALKKDCENAKYEDYQRVSRYVLMTYPDFSGQSDVANYTRYPLSLPESFENTLAVLSENGILLDAEADKSAFYSDIDTIYGINGPVNKDADKKRIMEAALPSPFNSCNASLCFQEASEVFYLLVKLDDMAFIRVKTFIPA